MGSLAGGGRGANMMGWFYPMMGGNFGLTNFTLDASDDALEFRFCMPGGYAGGALTRAQFRQGTLTGVAPVFRISLQGMGTDGLPDGVIKGAGNGCYFDYTPTSGNNSTAQWGTFGVSYTPAPGEALFLVIKYLSGTIDASNKCTFGQHGQTGLGSAFFVPISNNSGTRTVFAQWATFAIGTATEIFGQPAETTYATALNSTLSPDELAVKFLLPSYLGATYKISGVSLQPGTVTAAGTMTITLYDTNGTTVLQRAVVDHDVGVSNVWWQYLPFDETTLATLNFGSTYRLSVAPDSATGFVVIGFDADAATDLEAYPLGQNISGSHQANAAGWTDTPARRYGIAPWISEWTAGGGGSIFPGMVVR